MSSRSIMSEYTLVPNTTLRVAISGKSGCGNTTVSTLLAEKLGITLINFTFRQLAAEKGLTLAQVIENARTDDRYDRAVDTRQVELARAESCVLGSRLAIWMLKEADVKVYLIASDDTRAKRILNREGGDLQQIKDFTAMRDREDSARYLKLYGIDNDEYEFADLKIDTATRTPEQIVSLIIDYLEKNGRVVRK
ncbi:MAG: cytidylate kinase family protein [Treponemataceae bacterium]|nr:cytidylate kinase family protein [Treponemataceae bacterium]